MNVLTTLRRILQPLYLVVILSHGGPAWAFTLHFDDATVIGISDLVVPVPAPARTFDIEFLAGEYDLLFPDGNLVDRATARHVGDRVSSVLSLSGGPTVAGGNTFFIAHEELPRDEVLAVLVECQSCPGGSWQSDVEPDARRDTRSFLTWAVITPVPVPAPPALPLVVIGLLSIGVWRSRRPVRGSASPFAELTHPG